MPTSARIFYCSFAKNTTIKGTCAKDMWTSLYDFLTAVHESTISELKLQEMVILDHGFTYLLI